MEWKYPDILQHVSEDIYGIVIEDYAEKIRGRIKDGMIYGKKVDLSNADHVILSAYLLGTLDASPVKSKLSF